MPRMRAWTSCADEATPKQAFHILPNRTQQPIEYPTQVAIPCSFRTAGVSF